MDRTKAYEVVVKTMYGAPGESHDTEKGRDLIIALVFEMGLAALTDDALVRLARLHEEQDRIDIRRATVS